MAYNMNDPAQRAIVHDRFMAGICPTLGPQRKTRARRHAKAAKLTKDRLAREAAEPNRTEEDKAQERRMEFFERQKQIRGRPRPPPRPKPTLVDIARENLQRSLGRPPQSYLHPIPRSKPARVSFALDDHPQGRPQARPSQVQVLSTGNIALPDGPGLAFRDRLAAYFGKEFAEECERQKKELKKVVYAQQERAQLEGVMRMVAAEILEVGSEKRRLEKAERGPAPDGLWFVQEGDVVFLARVDGEGPHMLVGYADEIRIKRDEDKRRTFFRMTLVDVNAHQIEAAWASSNNPSCREMGPGKRREVVDVFGDGGYARFENRAARRRRILEERKARSKKSKSPF
ncbi:hypothetical protein R3P38DRAFT_3211090 [Favolaschia claudopus]|uniref:Uncharacterized protein n=1 Tax=Favolaschia claudopus TaxID=2862362 RepID=A0AAW0AFV0_9AGAR